MFPSVITGQREQRELSLDTTDATMTLCELIDKDTVLEGWRGLENQSHSQEEVMMPRQM